MTSLVPCFLFSLVIPMEELNLTEPNAIRILHYLSPSRFYVYLQEKVDSYMLVNQSSISFLTREQHRDLCFSFKKICNKQYRVRPASPRRESTNQSLSSIEMPFGIERWYSVWLIWILIYFMRSCVFGRNASEHPSIERLFSRYRFTRMGSHGQHSFPSAYIFFPTSCGYTMPFVRCPSNVCKRTISMETRRCRTRRIPSGDHQYGRLSGVRLSREPLLRCVNRNSQ